MVHQQVVVGTWRRVRLGLKAFADGNCGGEIEAKLRPAATKGDIFNNVPRYEIAAYRLQMLYLDPDDYVTQQRPTVLRAVALEQ